MKRRMKESCMFCLGNRRKKAKQYYPSRLGYDISVFKVKKLNKIGEVDSNCRTTNELANSSNGPDDSEVIVPDTQDQEDSSGCDGYQSIEDNLNIVSLLFPSVRYNNSLCNYFCCHISFFLTYIMFMIS